MKALKYALIALVAVLIIAVGAIAFILNSVISGSQKDRFVAIASKNLGTQVGLESYSLDFASILALKPAVALNKLTIANPKGFPARNMLEAEKISALLDLTAALQKKIHVSSLEIENPKIVVEAPADGPTNLETLISNFKQSAPQQASAAPAAAEESIAVTVTNVAIRNGNVLLATSQNGGNPRPALKEVELTLSEFAPGKPCKVELTNKLFESANSSVKLNGSLGPLGGAGLPIDAKTNVTLALAEFPKDILQQFLGELASAPGSDSRINLDLGLAGDLYQTTAGKGKIDFSKFLIGSSKDNRLALSGQTPLEIKAERLISGEELNLMANNASLKLGSGTWGGNLQFIRKAGQLRGAINGGIQNVDVNQMLTSFANTPDKIYGTLTIPKFALNFAGDSAPVIQRSLNGNGSLQINNGRFKGLSVLSAIERALGTGTNRESGEFARFATNFAIANERIQMNGIDVAGPGIAIGGNGMVTFKEALDFKLQSKLTGNTADALRARTGGIMAGDLVVPVTIAGNLDNPQIRPEVKGLMKSAATSAVKGVLDRFLGGKKK